MWYIVVVFFNSGLVTGPAHFEEDWYPQPIGEALVSCRMVGEDVLAYLKTQAAQLKGEAFEVACFGASSVEELSDLINERWTFEPAPTMAPVPEVGA